jgi:hypothetical protein
MLLRTVTREEKEIISEASSIVELNLKSSLDYLNNALVAMYSDYFNMSQFLKN